MPGTETPAAHANAAVVAAYEAARGRGESRCNAFLKAVQAYRSRFPDLPAEHAGTEVARILLAATRAQPPGVSTSTLPGTNEMEYVEPA